MTIPIISTKLHVPQPPASLVSRPRLIARLEAGAQGKLILVSAPAGFGKTSLIAEWANQCREECLVSWVNLDESDNELIRFLGYLIAALQTHQKEIGEAALSGLQSIPPVPIEAALASLINEIDSLQERIILVLDDYHLINSTPIHEAVGFLIEHQPAQMCLVIATRTDPPLPIHRLRARGQMTEIRVDELRFNNEETRYMLEGILEKTIATDDITALDRRVEGWAAGLQMVGISMQDREDLHEFVQSFSGSHRYIMDYLTEEIFNQQPAHIQDFLLRTSVLDRLSGPLCDYLLGAELHAGDEQDEPPSAQQTLEYLEQANLFLLPMDQERRWYRYHNLFASLLQQRLRQTWPEEIPGLMRRAATWFADANYIEEAFTYALSTNDSDFAADLIESQSLNLLKSGALSTLLRGLKQLPEEIILERPWLNVYLSWALLLTGELGEIERYLGAAEDRQEALAEAKDLRGHVAAIRAYAALLRGNIELGYAQAQEALDLLPKDDLTVRSVVAFVMGGVNIMRQDIPGAIEAMQEAGEIGERAGNIHLAVSALSSAGSLMIGQGKLSEAERVYDRALKLATGKSGQLLPIAANIFSGLAQLYLAQNDLSKARDAAEKGVELAGQWGNVDSEAGNYISLAYVHRMEGNEAEAQQALEEVKRIAATHTLSPGFEERMAGFEAQAKTQPPGSPQQGLLVEPLTERELEVLRLMAEGRSNAEIAAELIVALGTVKAHTSSIYRKLDVRSRTEAVIKASELGLL
jgi:LuxR family maltose regulon positive regulatory protein